MIDVDLCSKKQMSPTNGKTSLLPITKKLLGLIISPSSAHCVGELIFFNSSEEKVLSSLSVEFFVLIQRERERRIFVDMLLGVALLS